MESCESVELLDCIEIYGVYINIYVIKTMEDLSEYKGGLVVKYPVFFPTLIYYGD